MYQNCCKKCGSISLHSEQSGNNTGLYCNDCGSWIKWVGKDELRAFEHSKNENSKSKCNTEPDSKDMITRLKEFIAFLDRAIDSEYEKMPLSVEDAIRKGSYCLALEKDKRAIMNILNGRDFNYIGEDQ